MAAQINTTHWYISFIFPSFNFLGFIYSVLKLCLLKNEKNMIDLGSVYAKYLN